MINDLGVPGSEKVTPSQCEGTLWPRTFACSVCENLTYVGKNLEKVDIHVCN